MSSRLRSGISGWQKQNSRVLENPAELLSFGFLAEWLDLVVHAAHSTHAAALRHGGSFVLLGHLCDESFCGEEESADGCRVLERTAGHFGWVDDAGFDEVHILASGDIVAFSAGTLLDFLHDERAFLAGIVGEGAERLLDGAADDAYTDRFVARELEVVERGLGADESDAAAGNDAFFHRCAGGVEGVFDAGFLLLHLGLGRGADIDDGDTTGQLGQALLELLAVVVRGGFLDLAADLGDAALDVFALAFTFDDRGGFLLDHDALGFAKVFNRDVLELDAEVFGDAAAAGEDGDVFEHGLAAVAEAGGFDGADLQRAAELVDHERGQRFAFDVFR